MPGVTISMPADMITKLKEKDISPSKIAQRGIEMLLEYGTDAFTNMKTENEQLKGEVELKTVANVELKKRLIEAQNKFIRKSMELAFPEIHRCLMNKEPLHFDIKEVRKGTGENIGIADLMDAYNNENLIDMEIDNIKEGTILEI